MKPDTPMMVPISEADTDFSRVMHMVDCYGRVVILKDMKCAELEPRMQQLQKEIEKLTAEAAPKEVADYTEKLTVLQYALEQYTNRDGGQDVPESVIEAFVVKIVVSKDGFDWYLRFDGDPNKPLHCQLQGKRKTKTKIMVAGDISPAMDNSATGCYQNWGGLICTSSFPSDTRKLLHTEKPRVSI